MENSGQTLVTLTDVIAVAVPTFLGLFSIIFFFIRWKLGVVDKNSTEIMTQRLDIQDLRKDVTHNKEILDDRIKQLFDKMEITMSNLNREVKGLKDLLNQALFNNDKTS